jgi:phosphatidylinositol glycan class B
MVATTLIAVEVGRRMAVRLAGPTAGVVATLILLACPLEIFFSPKVTAENLSGLVLLLAVHLSVTAAPIRPGVAGALAAFAIFLRYQNGLVAMGLLIVISAHDRRAALRYAGVATLVGVAGGMLDWLTWDYPFQAFVKYVQFNLIENKGEAFGVASTTYFVEHLFATMGWGFGILLVGGVLGARRMLGPSLIILAYFVVHSMIPHKEVRFLLPILPLALVISSVGLTELAIRLTNPAVTIALAASVATALAIHAWSPTERAFGRSDSSLSVWHSGEDYILTMWQAEARPDLCGIALVGTQPWWTGGYTNMHRDVPMYVNADHLASTNYVVGQRAEALPPEFERVFETGLYALFRRSGSCASDPAYRPWLN